MTARRLNSFAAGSGQRGAMLIVALFIIIIVAALGAFAVRVAGVHQQTATLDLLGKRAQAAADAGIEWGAFRALSAASCLPINPPFTLPATAASGALSGFTITVTCTKIPHPTATPIINSYYITADATSGAYGTPQYVARHASATFN